MFKQFRPLLQIVGELQRIATALEYFAAVDARANNRMFMPGNHKFKNLKDKSELIKSDPANEAALKAENDAILRERGYAGLELEDMRDD